MAGNYPDPLGHRMAYDADGTVGFWYWESNNIVTQLTSTELQELNDEDSGSVSFTGFGNFDIGLIFPETRDLAGYYYYDPGNQTTIVLSTSVDTTNGLDGTWTSRVNPWIKSTSPPPAYRTAQALSVTGIKAVKFQMNRASSGAFDDPNVRHIHIYGDTPSGATPDRLAFWDATLNQRINATYFDWGNVPRSSSADKQFRVKNLSTTKTAHGVIINAEALSDTTPSVPGQHLFSTDGTNFTATINIGDLAPTAISSLLTMRRVTPSTAALAVWTMRSKATATSWS